MRKTNIENINNTTCFYKKTMHLLKNAKKRILINSLYITDDKVGNEILSILSMLKEENKEINITINIDGVMGKKTIHTKYKNLIDNINIINVSSYMTYRVYHIKGWVIDDMLIYSGININNRYFSYLNKNRQDRYFFFKNKELCEEFIDTIHKIHGTNKVNSKREIKTTSCNGFEIIPLYGIGKNNIINAAIIQLISEAKNEVFLCSPYFNITNDIEDAIEEKLSQGVIVKIVIGINNENRTNYNDKIKYNNILSVIYLKILTDFIEKFKFRLNKTLFIYQWKDGDNSFHVKNLLIDNKKTLLTSSNFNFRSANLDYENALLMCANKNKSKALLVHEKLKIMENTCLLSTKEKLEFKYNIIEKSIHLLMNNKYLRGITRRMF